HAAIDAATVAIDEREAAARARVLRDHVGGLSVAVEMAARAITKWKLGWSEYERLLRAHETRLLEDPKLYGDYPRGVFAALDLSIERCSSHHGSFIGASAAPGGGARSICATWRCP